MRTYIDLIVIAIFVALPAYPHAQVSGNSPPADTHQRTTPTSPPADSSSEMLTQADIETSADASGESYSPMLTPDPVSTTGYSMEFSSELHRSNYIGGGLTISSSYDDRAFLSTNGQPLTDISYSVRPTFSWNKSTSRLLGKLFYSPGFTFYQRNSSLNQSDQNLILETAYRLSPHVTVILQDRFYKTSNLLSVFEQNANTPIGATQPPVATVVSPVADQITNVGSAQVTYQFAPNTMVGVTGEFSALHYLNSTQVPALFDSRSRAVGGFYSRRLSDRHYMGLRYEYQNLVSTPDDSQAQTHGVVLFYTLYLQPRISISFFAGPQHSNNYGGGLIPVNSWSPTYGGSFGWQSGYTSLALSASRSISAGGGLQGAVRSANVNASVRRQLAKALSAQLSAFYSKNTVLGALPQFSDGGHTTSGTVSLNRQVQENLDLTLAYTRLQQKYSNIATFSSAPNQNRVSISLSYQFTRRRIGQ